MSEQIQWRRKASQFAFLHCAVSVCQDPEAQRKSLRELGVHENRIYTDHELTGTNREHPGLDQALAALREGDMLVVAKLDRLARSVPDARTIAEELQRSSPYHGRPSIER